MRPGERIPKQRPAYNYCCQRGKTGEARPGTAGGCEEGRAKPTQPARNDTEGPSVERERQRDAERETRERRQRERDAREGIQGVDRAGKGFCLNLRSSQNPSRTVSFSRTMSRWESNTSGEGPCIYVTSAQDPPIGSMPSPREATTEGGGAGVNRRDPSNRNRGCECTRPGPRVTVSARVIAGARPLVAVPPTRPEQVRA